MILDRYIHDIIFNHLSGLHEEDESFLFRIRRSNRYNRLAMGFWFHGNENYLALSFWSGSDWKNKTPNISFIFLQDGSVHLQLSAKDSDYKSLFFFESFFSEGKNGFNLIGDHLAPKVDYNSEDGDEMGILFYKVLDYKWNISNITDILDEIIENEKKEIDIKLDNWLTKNTEQGANPLQRIDKKDFIRLRDRVLNYQTELLENDLLENPFSPTTLSMIIDVTDEQKAIREERLKKILNDLNVGFSNFHIKKYKELIDIKVEDIPKETQWIFVSGENGTGKSSLLEALVIALNGNVDENILLAQGNFDIEASINFSNELILNKVYSGEDNDNLSFRKIENFACYGPSRFDISSSPSTTKINLKSKTYNLFHDNGKLLNIEDELIKWDLKALLYFNGGVIEQQSENHPNPFAKYAKYLDLYHHVKEIFVGKGEGSSGSEILQKGLLPDVVEMEPKKEKDDDRIYYRVGKSSLEQIQEHFKREERLFNQLSTGNKSLIAMVGDLILRFIEIKKNKNADEYPDPSNFEGIVLIDEIDAHIHPKWQMDLPSILSELFPRVQFIVSCHSPIPFMGIPEKERSLFLKLKRNEDFQIELEKLDYLDIYRLTPEAILTSPIFDFKELYLTKDPSLRFSTNKDYNEEVFDRMLKQKLEDKAKQINLKRNEKN